MPKVENTLKWSEQIKGVTFKITIDGPGALYEPLRAILDKAAAVIIDVAKHPGQYDLPFDDPAGTEKGGE